MDVLLLYLIGCLVLRSDWMLSFKIWLDVQLWYLIGCSALISDWIISHWLDVIGLIEWEYVFYNSSGIFWKQLLIFLDVYRIHVLCFILSLWSQWSSFNGKLVITELLIHYYTPINQSINQSILSEEDKIEMRKLLGIFMRLSFIVIFWQFCPDVLSSWLSYFNYA